MPDRLRMRAHLGGYLIGLAVTVAAVGVYALGWTRALELMALDVQFRRCNRVPASEDIVHVDIDDAALERVGRWPWPRDVHAGLVRTLSRAGARLIVMDIVFSEPEAPSVRLPTLTADVDLEGPIEQLGELSAENIVYADDELAAAIHDAGNVYLAMFFSVVGSEGWTSRGDAKRRRAIRAEAFGDADRARLTEQIRSLLLKDFELDAEAVAARLNRQPQDVRAVLAGLKRAVALELVGRELDRNAAADFAQVHKAILHTPPDRQTADRADILWAYRQQLSLRSVRQKCSKVPVGLAGALPEAIDLTPPLYKFAAAARGVGFVTFEPDRIDGMMRHQPLLAEYRGVLLKQLAFAVACDVLGIRDEQLRLSGDWLEIAGSADCKPMRIQLDARKRMLVNWYSGSKRWQTTFRHIPVSRILEVFDRQQKIRQNEIRRRYALGEVVRIVKGEAFEAYRQAVREMLALRRELHLAELRGRGQDSATEQLRRRLEAIGRRVHDEEQQAVDFVKLAWAELKDTDPNDPRASEDYRRYRRAYELAVERCAELDAVNRSLREQIRRIERELRAELAGKICLVGYTATAVADFVPTPVFPRAPGVVVHSNTLNTFLQGRFVRWNRSSTEVLLILLAGVVTTLVTASRGPIVSFLCVVVAIPAVVLLGAAALFWGLGFWVAVVLPLMLMFVAWAFITLYRQLSEERQKRNLAGVLGQYTAPQIAQQIVQNPVHRDLSPRQAEVTCFFSDLRGFTPISERLGPARTRSLLNPYLEAMADVLIEHRAMVNKFIGDGIFAFFNSPLLPCPDHGRRACESALACCEALDRLKQTYAAHELADEFAALQMRIGLSSGPVFVGDYGSENKRDYTCIGDTVNLAARLEPANKAFGTQILVAGPTERQAREDYEFRYLGRLQVVGRQEAVDVFELLGRRGQVDEHRRRHARLFARAVALFQARRWDQACEAFGECLTLRSPDAGVDAYLQAIAGYRTSPPPADWPGAIELAQK